MTVEEMGSSSKGGTHMIRAADQVQEKKKKKVVVPVRGRGRIKRLIFACIGRKVKLMVRYCGARLTKCSGEV
ncbi:hypothetical protein AAC387_Pa04g2573 [Persea americana]